MAKIEPTSGYQPLTPERKAELLRLHLRYVKKIEDEWEDYCRRQRIAYENNEYWQDERENESPEDRAHDRLSLERDVFLLPKSKKKKKKKGKGLTNNECP